MKNRTKVLMIAGLVAIAVLTFGGCSLSSGVVPEIEGTWEDEFGGVRVISGTEIRKFADADATTPEYVYEIVDGHNTRFNGGETGAGDCGYSVVKCTTPPSWNTDQEGTFTVFRWQNFETTGGITTVEFAEGSPPDWPDGYAETADEAVENATEANGWFGLGYTEATLQ
jgi:hypothetical protein